MSAKEKIDAAAGDLESLEIIHYPDPRLKEDCTPLEAVDEAVAAFAERLVELMFASNGVGLAAPQIGVTVRMFAATPSFQRDDVHVYINPRIVEHDGQCTDEEGCLSFPNIFAKIKRARQVTIEALGLDGKPFRQSLDGLHSRIVQHENDHLDGVLLVDRMGSVARLGHRKALAAMEEEFVAS